MRALLCWTVLSYWMSFGSAFNTLMVRRGGLRMQAATEGGVEPAPVAIAPAGQKKLPCKLNRLPFMDQFTQLGHVLMPSTARSAAAGVGDMSVGPELAKTVLYDLEKVRKEVRKESQKVMMPYDRENEEDDEDGDAAAVDDGAQRRQQQGPGRSFDLPLEYCAALFFLGRLTARVKDTHRELYASFKFVNKKNGLGRHILAVETGQYPLLKAERDIRAVMVTIEKSICEAEMVLTAFNTLQRSHTSGVEAKPTGFGGGSPETQQQQDTSIREDFLWGLRPLLEHCQGRNRAEIVGVYTRGLFGVYFGKHKNPLLEKGAYRSIKEAFPGGANQRKRDRVGAGSEGDTRPQPTASARLGGRLAWPFLLFARRWYLSPFGADTPGDVDELVRQLMQASPSGETLRSLHRWLFGMLSLSAQEADDSFSDTIFRNGDPLFIDGNKKRRQRWLKGQSEVGLLVGLMAEGCSKKGLRGKELVQHVNFIMFVPAFVRRLPLNSKGRAPYERVLKRASMAELSPAERERLSAQVLEVLQMALVDLLGVTPEEAQTQACQASISVFLQTWKAPHLLTDYYNMHRNNPSVLGVFQRFLRALFSVSDETVADLRFRDSANAAHLSLFNEKIRRRWEDVEGVLAGTNDPETLFRLGEDTRSCMAINPANRKSNAALLGYLLQGNSRLLLVQDEEGAVLARSVVRLLARGDTGDPVLWADMVYFASGVDPALERLIWEQALRLSKQMGVPVYRAEDTLPPPPAHRLNSPFIETQSLNTVGRNTEGSSGCADADGAELIELDGISNYIHSDAVRTTGEGRLGADCFLRRPPVLPLEQSENEEGTTLEAVDSRGARQLALARLSYSATPAR